MLTRRLRRGLPHARGKSPSRTRTFLGLTLAVVLSITLTACQDADTQEKEEVLLSHLQQARSHARLAPLSHHAGLRDIARIHAEHLSQTQQLSHLGNLGESVDTVVRWQRVGENVGYGSTMQAIHDKFMSSAGHRANILGQYNLVGIGVSRDGAGRYWVVQVFALG